MVKHKSRLEREKEVAEQQRKVEEAAQAQKAKRKVVHTPGSWTKQVISPHSVINVIIVNYQLFHNLLTNLGLFCCCYYDQQQQQQQQQKQYQ